MNNPAKNLKNQYNYIKRMQETHTRYNLWIDKADMELIKRFAEKKGLLNATGRNYGEVNLQQAITEVLKIGLDVVKDNS